MILALEKLLKTPNRHHNLKWLIREIKSLDRHNAISFLQKADLFIYGYNGINIGKSSDDTHGLMVKILIPYLLDKVISFSDGRKIIYFDVPHLHNMSVSYNKNSHVLFSSLYNCASNITKIFFSDEIVSIAKIMLPLNKEQMKIQQNNTHSFNRFYNIFAQEDSISQEFEKQFGIDLHQVSILSWALFAYIQENVFGDEKVGFKKEDFVSFTHTLRNISHEDKEKFLNFISLSPKDYKAYYLMDRKDSDGKLYSYEEQEYFDRALPKVSYQFPLIKESNIYYPISLTSFFYFMRMERFYRIMTHEIKGFKGSISGPRIETHIRELMQRYLDTSSTNGNVSGDARYYPFGKSKPKDEPDAILETDNYVLFVESKSSAFNLKLYREMKETHILRLIENIKKSLKNIDLYCDYHKERLKGKKILKIISFYEEDTTTMELLLNNISKHITNEEYLLLGIDDLHRYLIPNNNSLDNIYTSYLQVRPTHTTNFEFFMHKQGVEEKSLFGDVHYLKDLAEKFHLPHK
ncbi:hypothetical protein JHD47_07670 [Sulfurimonas sp. SAG-AH-194-L11]|nr:hypothetical protein [Sulfurimonas sp. SAG-AH-194-L11]MDF1877692.1 hypothetical protein [Sulfurimonas sp. SAG-AH-194-L11]